MRQTEDVILVLYTGSGLLHVNYWVAKLNHKLPLGTILLAAELGTAKIDSREVFIPSLFADAHFICYFIFFLVAVHSKDYLVFITLEAIHCICRHLHHNNCDDGSANFDLSSHGKNSLNLIRDNILNTISGYIIAYCRLMGCPYRASSGSQQIASAFKWVRKIVITKIWPLKHSQIFQQQAAIKTRDHRATLPKGDPESRGDNWTLQQNVFSHLYHCYWAANDPNYFRAIVG